MSCHTRMASHCLLEQWVSADTTAGTKRESPAIFLRFQISRFGYSWQTYVWTFNFCTSFRAYFALLSCKRAVEITHIRVFSEGNCPKVPSTECQVRWSTACLPNQCYCYYIVLLLLFRRLQRSWNWMGLPCLTPLLAVALVATGMPWWISKNERLLRLFFWISGAKPTQKEEGTLLSGGMIL